MEEKIVYLVWSDQYGDADIEGVFSSLENAEQFVRENFRQWFSRCSIQEVYVDQGIDWENTTVKCWNIEGYVEGEKELIEIEL